MMEQKTRKTLKRMRTGTKEAGSRGEDTKMMKKKKRKEWMRRAVMKK